MGKKKTKETTKAEESQNDESQAQSGIFTTLFPGDVAEGESAGFSSLFSDDNPFRRKQPEPKPEENPNSISPESKKGNKRNVDNDEEEETVALVKTKKSKKGEKLKSPISDSEGVEKETNSDVVESGLETKRKKRKRDEIENEYETKKYGSVEKKEKKVGEKRKKADEIADTMVSKEGFDDESKLLRTVFVGNLPLKVKKKLILKEFSKFGKVESVRIRSVPIVDSKRTRKGAIMLKQLNEKASSVHAYVVFETEQSAEASLALNMSLIDGNHIRVDRACPPRKKLKGEDAHLYDTKRTVFMGNLPFDVKDEEVYQLFTGKSNLENSIEAVRVIRDPHLNIGKGIAYVLFKTREAANLVIKKGYLKLRDRELRISRVKPDATPSKRKNSSSEAYSPAQKRQQKDKVVTPVATGKANLSYQGVRASKSGDDKKKPYQKSPAQSKMRPRSSSSSSNEGNNKAAGNNSSALKQRSQKRPAVAARKAKANAKESGGGKRFAGTKRKQESRTPESFSKKKKPKRF
ncbi:hypothetical protein EUTSA_v10000858mg [Eutrema salsugineum]|uniref:RRM domain-containing protein n=1 Tax=Eutrema salsugineum TaxID=72664 RepID=V4N3H4_EUTSA|nr:RNA-binding protein 34 [Eutrema salsugineum]ESQ39831.1 hypothetical protein EUTSA_v10000858mg [Eutrema salsugineum]